MSTTKAECGPNATDEYGGWINTYHRTHVIRGTGVITHNHASYNSLDFERYEIKSGITELGDNCFSNCSISSISLPDTLTKIGTSCFRDSKITSISLPDSLEEIGHTNFPYSLTSITIPSKIKDFPTDNLYNCTHLSSVGVDKNNKFYRSIDGILYNYDITEILLCPRAKSGKVIIPDTVRHIAKNCFKDCKNLTMIELPRSIKTIEEYAFSGLNIDRLVIPNSVTSIGTGCFAQTIIRKTFRFPQGITELSSFCFDKATIPSMNLIKGIEFIGDHCFEATSKNETLPEYLILPKIKHIGKFAFSNAKKIKLVEFSSSLSYIGESAFDSTADNLKIICASMVPVKLPDGAFRGISDNATLFIPKGTKIIYENTLPWSTIANIEEFDLDHNFCDEEKDISDELLYSRLNSIAHSIRNIDRQYLKEILTDIAMFYRDVDNEDDYGIAMHLLRYNRRFSPVLIDDMEKKISEIWTNRYKFRLLGEVIFDSYSLPIGLATNSIELDLEKTEVNDLLLLGDHRGIEQDAVEVIDVRFSDILQLLQSELSLAETSIKIAVSWFTNYALFKQIKDIAQNGIEINLIINNDSVNNSGYCLDFNELLAAGVHVSLVEYPNLLHHKFCIIDNKVVINGSYNWTRFSEKNYENITVFRNIDFVTNSFNEEFEKILKKAEHKNIDSMPDRVPLRPEYDRNAFKQYITEELDAEARETSDQRDKVTVLHKAAKLNPEYFNKLNPNTEESLFEALDVVKESINMKKDIASIVKGEALASNTALSEPISSEMSNQSPVSESASSSTDIVNPPSAQATITIEEQAIIETVKATDLFMVLDVSGSMQNTYSAGHVYNITKKAVSAALAVSNTQEVSLWKFGDTSSFVKNISISNLTDINEVKCLNTGTQLSSFIESANSSIKENSLVIIFTDDDGGSIKAALVGMKSRTNVFWQIIVYGSQTNVASAISGSSNVSIINMTDYNSMNDSEITKILLMDFINWKKADKTTSTD